MQYPCVKHCSDDYRGLCWSRRLVKMTYEAPVILQPQDSKAKAKSF